MTLKLKRNQIPEQKANIWRKSFKEEEKLTLNIDVQKIILQKETYKILAGENENRVRIYLGLEPVEENEKLKLCAFAVSAFLLGSGDVYVDYEAPVFKLNKENLDFSSRTIEVIKSIKRYRSWRVGELDAETEGAEIRKYIYPKAYLLTKFELHEIFNVQNKKEAVIELGISKTMNAMIVSGGGENVGLNGGGLEIFNEVQPCPPYCDDRSIYNTSDL